RLVFPIPLLVDLAERPVGVSSLDELGEELRRPYQVRLRRTVVLVLVEQEAQLEVREEVVSVAPDQFDERFALGRPSLGGALEIEARGQVAQPSVDEARVLGVQTRRVQAERAPEDLLGRQVLAVEAQGFAELVEAELGLDQLADQRG